MHKFLATSSIIALLMVGYTAESSAYDLFNDMKKQSQESIAQFKTEYPREYTAVQQGCTYGALAGAAKSFLPFVPKRGNGLISCTLIAAVVGASANIALHSNAEYLAGAKKRADYVLSDEGKKQLSSHVAQALVEKETPRDIANHASQQLNLQIEEIVQAKKEVKEVDEKTLALLTKIAAGIAFLVA